MHIYIVYKQYLYLILSYHIIKNDLYFICFCCLSLFLLLHIRIEFVVSFVCAL